MSESLKEIRAVEDKYGLMLFRMGLTHLVDVGIRHMSDDDLVEDNIKTIMAQSEDRDNGVIPVLTPEYQCEILCCAAELAKFSIWTLFAYIKKYVTVSI